MLMSTIQASVKGGNIRWRKHALERMFQRNISRQDIKHRINSGTILKNILIQIHIQLI